MLSAGYENTEQLCIFSRISLLVEGVGSGLRLVILLVAVDASFFILDISFKYVCLPNCHFGISFGLYFRLYLII